LPGVYAQTPAVRKSRRTAPDEVGNLQPPPPASAGFSLDAGYGISVHCGVHTVVETSAYLAAAKAAGMSDSERTMVVDLVAADPHAGDLMQGTGGCRKLRLAGRGKGKSGGYRVITLFGGGDVPVFLMTVFGKGEKDNLTRAERNQLATVTTAILREYPNRVRTEKR
jgi:hypothetical protein